MKKITLIGLVLWFFSGHVCAEIAIIAPFSDENCNQFFDNKTLLPSPEWTDSSNTGLIVLFVNVIVRKVAENSAKSGFQTVNEDNPSENNLYCFPVPDTLMAKGVAYRQNVFWANKEMANLARKTSFIAANSAACCFVHYPLARQLITT